MNNKMCAGCRKENCAGCKRNQKEKLHTNKNVVLPTMQIFSDKSTDGYGLVFDVGTTTVAAYLWELCTGACLGAQSCSNPQSVYGNDVISRITYCTTDDPKSSRTRQMELQQSIVMTMETLTEQLICEAAGVSTEKIVKATVVGNTVMCSILAGISLQGLGSAPFEKPYHTSVRSKGEALGFRKLGQVMFVILPPIEGYVGADALAVYQYIKATDNRSKLLAVDIGTNAEIILIAEDSVYACSAPAGPALEGAAVSQGMCALTGAITAVKEVGMFPRERLYCEVIGKEAPQGICGSGLIDAMALLYRQKIIDKDGAIRSPQKARQAGGKEALCRRIIQESEYKVLLTTMEHPVYLTAGDIRQLQLAKSAVSAAIQILLEKAGVGIREITQIYLTGAFGSCINKESAITIGLLPRIAEGKIVSVPNGAALGGAMALLDGETEKEMEDAALSIRHIELASEKTFEEYFIKGMAMP